MYKRQLEELIAAGGMVAAPCDGTVTLAEVEQGKKLTGEERFFLSSGDLVFEGSFDRDEDEMCIRDRSKAVEKIAGVWMFRRRRACRSVRPSISGSIRSMIRQS